MTEFKRPSSHAARRTSHGEDPAAHNPSMSATLTEQRAIVTPWLSTDDLAEYIRSPKATIYRWRYLGEGPRRSAGAVPPRRRRRLGY